MQKLLEDYKKAKENPALLARVYADAVEMFAEMSWDYEQKMNEIIEARRNLIMNSKSAAQAENEYRASDMGKYEKQIKIRLNAVEKIIGYCKKKQEIMGGEIRNIY